MAWKIPLLGRMQPVVPLLLFVAGLCCSCGRGTASRLVSSGPHVEISVYQNGRLLMDGEETTLDALAGRLDELKARDGAVWYYREPTAQEPTRVAADVLRLVVERQLPVSMSTKPDFSTYVGEGGRVHRR